MNLPRTVLDLDPDLKGIFYIVFHFYVVVSQLLGSVLENDIWTPPLLSILYMTIFFLQKISIHI